MGTQIFLGKPPANIEQWIKDHHGSSGHADTWYKYDGDTEWRTISITGFISGSSHMPTPQIPDIFSVVALEIGSDVTSIGESTFFNCDFLQSVTIPDSVRSIGSYAFHGCRGLTSVTFSGKDMTTVQGMSNYSWELPSGCVLHCTDGDITI